MDKAHQTGAKYERETSEFEAVGLTPAYEGDFPVPYVLESPLRMGLALAEKHELAVNGTILIAGSLQWVSLDDEALHPDGFVDLERLGSIAGVSLDGYYQGQLLERYDYPRPGEVAQPLEYPRSGKQT
jgi:flavin reductase (DIM6/NTAB) family NADH-FMN oxidoreductase RutF